MFADDVHFIDGDACSDDAASGLDDVVTREPRRERRLHASRAATGDEKEDVVVFAYEVE
jgi:hypothetical protein